MRAVGVGAVCVCVQEEKNVIALDASGLQLNRALREACSHFQLVSFDRVRGEAIEFLNQWRANLEQPKSAAQADIVSLGAYQAALTGFAKGMYG